jgi:hypothetical protein
MAKWPNVPNCYGWLGLDARGSWYMRDEAAQVAGSFASGLPEAKGSRLQHAKLIEFIQRNYAADASGQWYFQNGPQRVYVELEATPWIWRVDHDFCVAAHDGSVATWVQCWLDEFGWLYCETSLGFGLVHTQDVAVAAEAIEQGIWSVHDTLRTTLVARYGYVPSPQSLQTTKKPV